MLLKKFKNILSENREQEFLSKLFYNLDRVNYKRNVFPDGSAANASLLYTILKYMIIKKPINVLEFGAGQTTFLLNHLVNSVEELKLTKIITIEDDKFYANYVKTEILEKQHNIILTSQSSKSLFNFKENFYDVDFEGLVFDFVIVDGPKNMEDRLGSLFLFKKNIKLDNFIVIFDDMNKDIGGGDDERN